MILYLDASALVKRYVQEPGTEEVESAISAATIVTTGIASGAEVPAALARGVRSLRLTPAEAAQSLEDFWRHWTGFYRIDLLEGVVRSAAELAWRFGLRGFDAVHLASALVARESLASDTAIATFDRELFRAARSLGFATVPDDLETFLACARGGKRGDRR